MGRGHLHVMGLEDRSPPVGFKGKEGDEVSEKLKPFCKLILNFDVLESESVP